MPGTGTGSNGSTARRTPITEKKRSPATSTFLSASFANARAIARSASALFQKIRHFQTQIPRVGCVGHTRLKFDDSSANELFNFSIEVLHPFCRAIAHGVEKRFAFVFSLLDIFPSAHRGFQDFHGSYAPASAFLSKKALGNDEEQCICEL